MTAVGCYTVENVTVVASIEQWDLGVGESQVSHTVSAVHGGVCSTIARCARQSRGVRTMGGMRVLRDFVPSFDGTVVSRLPYCLQLAGPRMSEATLCRIAHAYEAATHGIRVTRSSKKQT